METTENNTLLTNFMRGAAIEHDISQPRCDMCGEPKPTAWLQQAEQKAAEAFADVKKVYDKVVPSYDACAINPTLEANCALMTGSD